MSLLILAVRAMPPASGDVTYRLIHANDDPLGKGLQRVYSFGEREQLAAESAGDFSDPCPWIVLCEYLYCCKEAWIAEIGESIIGAATLAFDGARGIPGSVLEGVYVRSQNRGEAVGLRLTELALERFHNLQRLPIRCIASSEAMLRTLLKLKSQRPELFQDFLRVRYE